MIEEQLLCYQYFLVAIDIETWYSGLGGAQATAGRGHRLSHWD
jgi:hypothetical protein